MQHYLYYKLIRSEYEALNKENYGRCGNQAIRLMSELAKLVRRQKIKV